MKTAEELYNKILDDDEFKSFPDGLMCMGQFKKALAEYRQSIIGLIDDRIEHLNPYSKNETILKQVLEELKQKIQSL